MADKTLSQIIGGGGLVSLAPDLTWPSGRQSTPLEYVQIAAIDASSGLTQIINLSGKFVIYYAELINLTAENNTIKLTVDGTVIWNDTYATGATDSLIGANTSTTSGQSSEAITCNSSFLLEYQTQTDTDIRFNYFVRPIL